MDILILTVSDENSTLCWVHCKNAFLLLTWQIILIVFI